MSRFFRPFPERTRVARAVAASGGGDPPAAPEGFLVPAVPSGLETDTALPTLPSPWTSSTSGFYYVKQGGSAGDNGTPAAPRGTIPNPIPAGGVVVLDNTATFTASNPTLSFSGTSGSRCWFVSSGMVGYGTADARATIDYTGGTTISGDYAYLDGINFDGGTADGTSVDAVTNILFRNCHFYGDGTIRASNNAGVALGGNSTSDRLADVVFYQCSSHDWGDWFPNSEMATDIDVHGVSFGLWIERVWILESQFYHCQGDGIQFTGGSPVTNGVTDVRNVYVQDCEFYENLQNSWWHKLGDSMVFARNTVHNMNYIDTASADSAPSIGAGGQYDFNNVWYLFNRFYDNDGAIQFASAFNGVAGQNIYIVGNVITNCVATVGIQTGSPNSTGCGVAFWQGVNCYVIGNTIHNYTGHGIAATPNSGLNLRVESNIVSGRSNGSCYDILLESYSTAPKIKNNSFPSSPRFFLSGSTTTSVSAMQTADSTNRQNNLSGSVSFTSAGSSGLGDYTVTAGDATIDAGDVISDVYATYLANFGVDIKLDKAGNARPVTTADWDIGAYERV